MNTKRLLVAGMIAFCGVFAHSQVLDSPVTVPLGITAAFDAGDDEFAYFQGSFGGGVSGAIYHEASWSPGWTESGKVWFNLRPGRDYDFFVESSYVGEFKLRFDPPAQHRVMIEQVNRLMHEGDGQFGSYYWTQFKVRVEVEGAEARGTIGTAGSLRPSRVLWNVSMGYLRNGRGAGSVQLRETTVDNAVNSGKLYYDDTSAEVHLVPGAGGTVRQVNAPDGLADVVTISSTKYDIRFYRKSQVGAFSNGVYQLSGSPFLTYTVEKVTTDYMRITMVRGARNEKTELQKMSATQWEVRDWTRTTLGEPCQRKIVYDYPSGTAVEIVTVTTGSTIATKTRKVYESVGGSLELVYENVGFNTVNQLTSYSYYDTPGSPGSHRKLRSVTRPDGSWVKYEYSNSPFERQGQLSLKHEPYLDAPAGVPSTPTTNGKITDYSYVADWTGTQRRLSGIATSINGTQTSQILITYADTTVSGRPLVEETRTEYTGDTVHGAETRTTKVKYYREDAPADTVQYWPGQLHSIEYPDGTKKVWSYAEGIFLPTQRIFSPLVGGECIGMWVVTGSSNPAHGSAWVGGSYPNDTVYVVPNQSTQEETLRSRSGVVYYTATWVHNGSYWVRPDGVLYSSTEDRQPRYQYHDNGRYSAEWDYVDGRVNWFKDADGVQTNYTYDRHGRVATTVKTGVAASGEFPSAADITVTFGYDADNRIVSTSTSAGTGEALVASRTFDQAGRPTSSTHHDSGSVLITYPSARETMLTLQCAYSGGTNPWTKIETYLDGRFKQRTGNGDVPAFVTYSVDGAGLETIEQRATSGSGNRWARQSRTGLAAP